MFVTLGQLDIRVFDTFALPPSLLLPNCKSSGDMDVLWPDLWIELGHWAGKEIVDRGCLLPAQGHTIIYLAHQTILLTFLPHGNRREQ